MNPYKLRSIAALALIFFIGTTAGAQNLSVREIMAEPTIAGCGSRARSCRRMDKKSFFCGMPTENYRGLNDMVIGRRAGNMRYFQNTGTSTAAIFSNTATVDTLGGILVGINSFSGHAAPAFYEVNNQYKLALGNDQGNVWLYDNIDFNIFGNFNLVQSVITKTEGIHATPAAFDIDNDGLMDLAIGNRSGGLGMFIQSTVNTLTENIVAINYKVTPNPAADFLNIYTDEITNNQFDDVSILDITGKQLYNSKIIKSNSQINISHLSRGFYFVKFNSGNTYKIVKM